MKVQTIASRLLTQSGRVDAGFHLAPGQLAAARLELARADGIPLVRLGDEGSVWSPNRFKRAYAAPDEPCVPYLRPYDVFNYLPEPADHLSVKRTKRLESYQLREGMILQTCSGRNLGPAVIVDSYMAGFVLSHDMIRVEIADERTRHYVLAFLQSRDGQALLRRDKTGSVIDHLSDHHIAAQTIPIFADIKPAVAEAMKKAVELRAEARLKHSELLQTLEAALPSLKPDGRRCDGWTVSSAAIGRSGRVDAASFDPLVSRVRSELLALGGVPVKEVATVRLPKRFKRQYTASMEYGKAMVSSAQLLEATPVNLQFILPKSFNDVANYELKANWIAYGADGRVEEALGTPVLITRDREGWFASNHVGRVIPNDGVCPGWLYLGLKARQSQVQLKAMASGSVVDATYPWDMEQVIIPPPAMVDGKAVLQVWEKFRKAKEHEDEAVRAINEALARFTAPV